MKRIIFVNRFFYPDLSATSQMLTDLAFDLSAVYDVHVIASRGLIHDAAAELPSSEHIKDVHVHRIWSTKFGRTKLIGRAVDYLTFYVSCFFALLWIAKSNAVVVFKTDPPLIGVVGLLPALLRRARAINWVQDLFPEVARRLAVPIPTPVFWILQRFRNWSLRSAQKNVAIGELMSRYLRERCKVPIEKVTVISNWADGEIIYPVPREDNVLRRAWSLTEKFVVAYSGNMGRAHEFGAILQVASKLPPDVHFIFIGDGNKASWVRDEARRNGLSERVSFQPFQSRELLAESLSVADVHLVSLNPVLEGLIVPSKFYGIAASGRPTIFLGSVSGEIASLINRYECGFSVDSSDVGGLARAIQALRDNPTLLMTMSKNARNAFDKHFERACAAKAWEEVINAA